MAEESVRRIGALRADTAIWLAVGLLFFFASAVLTRYITRIEHKAQQSGIVLSIDGPYDGLHPRVNLEEKDGALKLLFQNNGQRITSIRFGPFSHIGAVFCTTPSTDVVGKPVRATGRERELVEFVPKAGWSFEIDDSKVANDRFSLGLREDIDCTIPDLAVHDTFTSRSLVVVENDRAETLGETFIAPEVISLANADTQEMHVTNLGTGETRLEFAISAPMPAPLDVPAAAFTKSPPLTPRLRFSWDSVVAAERRDIAIVVIGSLIALGAAALIEAARPYVETVVRRSTN